MDPKAIPAALRDFAAAAATSPDPAKSVADLALLIAELFDQARAFVEADAEAPAGAPIEHDEMAFPPLDPIAVTTLAGQSTDSDLRMELARAAYEHGPEAFDLLPAEEQTIHLQLALAKLHQEQATDTAGA